jgi:hypothetical protein
MKALNKKRRGAEISRFEAMNCIPMKNRQARETRGEDGLVLLSYPIEIRPWIAGWFRRFGVSSDSDRIKKLQLDELGTTVWDLLDGSRSVGDVIRLFTAMQRLHPKEATVAVTLFLRELGKRGLIGLR